MRVVLNAHLGKYSEALKELNYLVSIQRHLRLFQQHKPIRL